MDLMDLHFLFKKMIPLDPLTNFEIQKYYQNEPRFNGVYSRDNLPKTKFHDKIKDEMYVISLDEYTDIGIHWTALYKSNNKVTYFDSFGFEHIPKEIKKFIKGSVDKFTNVTNISRIQAYDSVMPRYFFIGFTDFMFKVKSLIDVTILFLPNDFKKKMMI